jgi:hypothetical protein
MLQYVRPPNRAESCVSGKRVPRWRTTVRVFGARKQTGAAPKKRAQPLPRNSTRSRYSAVVPGAPTAGAAAFPPCALPAAGRLGAAFRPANRLPWRDRRL